MGRRSASSATRCHSLTVPPARTTTTYAADQQTFPIKSERVLFWAAMAFAFIAMPLLLGAYPEGSTYWVKAILLPFLVWSMIALGLNILTGYCGQVSLGTGGFMAVGAFACYKLMTAFPDLNIIICIVLSGAVTAGGGVLFGLPAFRVERLGGLLRFFVVLQQ